jgi:DtxR family transcriptional regulator, Mn-dependent transcriptional regulator
MNSLLLVVLGIMLAAVFFLLRSERGFAWRPRDRKLRRRRMLMEDILKCLHEIEYAGGTATGRQLAEDLDLQPEQAEELLRDLRSRGLVRCERDAVSLSPQGSEEAVHLVRAHRLWETYLAQETGLDEFEWHRRADKQEHWISRSQLDALAARIGNPTHDPHGDPIPTAAGELPEPEGLPLSAATPGQWVRVSHLEDEPAERYLLIRSQGMYRGMELCPTEVSGEGVRFQSDGKEYQLPASAASAVTVVPQAKPAPASSHLLSDLRQGEEATIVAVSKACHAAERRRLMDLGILPGTRIRAELISPAGDPVAYRVRGALIGLRREQAKQIRINPREEVSA